MKCANCEKVLTTKMEVEYSAWLTEYYCSPKCATDRYFNYMESTPVDFDNLPNGLEVVNGRLEAAEHRVHQTAGGRRVLNSKLVVPAAGNA